MKFGDTTNIGDQIEAYNMKNWFGLPMIQKSKGWWKHSFITLGYTTGPGEERFYNTLTNNLSLKMMNSQQPKNTSL